MLATCAALLLSAAPVSIEVLGFTVENGDGVVIVTAVQEGSAAAKAGLEPGTVLLGRLLSPQWPFARGELSSLSDVDLHDALTPPHGEALVMRTKKGEKQRTVSMTRGDPPPPGDPFPTNLSAEKLKRLSLSQQARYYASLGTRMSQRPPDTTPALSIEDQPSVTVGPSGVTEGLSAVWTPQWVFLSGRLAYHCVKAPMRSIELTSTAPVPRVVAESKDAHLESSSVEVQLPLWRVSEVKEACRKEQTTLPSVKLTATLRCEGQEPKVLELSRPLALRCDGPKETKHRLDGLRVEDTAKILVGDQAPRTVKLWWRAFAPTPVSVDVLELDASGALRGRLVTVRPPSEGDETKTPVRLDTSAARQLTLVPEVKFSDGSLERGTPQPLRIWTAAQYDAEMKAFLGRTHALAAVQQRLLKARPDPCADIPGSVAWLQKQPEVQHASADGTHSLSFIVGGLPLLVSCHRP